MLILHHGLWGGDELSYLPPNIFRCIYSDGDNIIIIIIIGVFLGLRFKLVLRWYFVGCYPLLMENKGGEEERRRR